MPLTQAFCGLQQRLPEPIVETHHQAGPGVAKRLQPLQHPLDVLQRVQGVRQQDHIERLGLADGCRGHGFGVGRQDPQFGMPLPGNSSHLRVQLNPHAVGRLQVSQQVTGAAAHLQHPQPRWNQELVQPLEIRVIGAVALAELDLLARGGHERSRLRVWGRSRRRALATMRSVRKVELLGLIFAA